MPRAHAIPPLRGCALVHLCPGADLLDAFAVPLSPGAPDDIGVLARALWGGI